MRFCSKIAADKLSYIFQCCSSGEKATSEEFPCKCQITWTSFSLPIKQEGSWHFDKDLNWIVGFLYRDFKIFLIPVACFRFNQCKTIASGCQTPILLHVSSSKWVWNFFSTYVLLKGNFNHSSWTIELITQPFESGFAFPQKDLNRLRIQHFTCSFLKLNSKSDTKETYPH